jgi:hypothetical protein
MSDENINLNKKLEEIKVKANFRDLGKLRIPLQIFQGLFAMITILIIFGIYKQIENVNSSYYSDNMTTFYLIIVSGGLILVNYALIKIIDVIEHLLS